MRRKAEYRPTEYLQNWVAFWFDDTLRLAAAKRFQQVRLQHIEHHWLSSRMRREPHFPLMEEPLLALLSKAQTQMAQADTHNTLMLQEAQLTKALYKLVSQTVKYGDFTRAKRGGGTDAANRFLDHGNYLAYGLAAVAAWVTGLPHGLAVMHGKTRRGGLVFDIADLIKDALVMPQAFIAAMTGDDEQAFRQRCITGFQQADALDLMINTLQETACELGGKAR